MIDVTDNDFLRNEAKTLLRQVRIEHSTTAHNFNQIKAKTKEVSIVVENLPKEETNNALG